MLRVRRSSVPTPEALRLEEVRQARLAIVDYLRLDPSRQEQRRAPVNDRIFRHPTVVDALRQLFRDKCAYCETAIPHGDEHVDHFRPLGPARGLDGAEVRQHYVWLAYEWENLLLACSSCSKAKSGLFPVAGARARLRATLDEVLAEETAELIDPSRDDPWAELPMFADGTCRPTRRRGQVTAAVLQLNRPGLVRRRREDLSELRERFQFAMRRGGEEDLSLLFDSSREFVGSRLDLLHRTASRWESRTRPPAARQSLAAWFMTEMRGASDEARSSLASVLEEIFTQDEQLPELVPGEVDRLAAASVRLPPSALSGGVRRHFPDREIRSIEVRNFKGIEALDLEFARGGDRRSDLPCLMLLGENSAGKSSVLEAVALALVGTKAASRLGIPPSEFLRRDDPVGFDIIDPPAPHVVVRFRDDGEPAVFGVSREDLRYEGTAAPSVMVLAYGARRRFSTSVRPPSEPSHLVRNLFKADTALPSAAPWLLRISDDRETFNAVARALREVLALDETDELVLDPSGRPSVSVMGRLVPVERLSEGYRSLFSLAVDIMRNLLGSWPDLERARAVVLLDEVETHLHPRWKMRIVSALRRAFPGVQFIVSTHDPLCLRGMDDGEVEVIERDGEGRVSRLDDLPSVRGMGAEQLLTSEYFGLNSTSDPELEWELARVSDEDTSGRAGDRARDDDLISRIVLGDTLKQQLIHEALDLYLARREQRRGQVVARREAVEAVLRVLETDDQADAT